MKNPSFLHYFRSHGLPLMGAAILMGAILGSAALYNHLHPRGFTYQNRSQVDIGWQALQDYQKGRYHEAEIGFRAATFLEPSRMENWYNLGNACFKQGKYKDARGLPEGL
jgi:hypothetical protein